METREKLIAWGLDLVDRGAHPSVLIAVRPGRTDPGEDPLVILADGLERHQIIAVLRAAVRQLGGAFAG